MTPFLLPYRPEMAKEAVALWNAAMGEAFPMRDALWRQHTADDPHFDPEGCWVVPAPQGSRLLGMCLAKVAREPLGTDGLLEDRGWVSLIAVHPDARRRGLGTALLRRAETFLRRRDRRRIFLGGDPAHFFPGVPAGIGPAAWAEEAAGMPPAVLFFQSRGYRFQGEAYDLHRLLRDYKTPPDVGTALGAAPGADVRPLREEESPRLLVFLDAVFPGRWRYTVGRYLAGGGDIADIMGVVRGGEVLGFAHLFHPRSRWLGPSIAWAGDRASRAGGLGPMGLAPALRGRGLGLVLLDRAIRHLASLGVEEIVIDWTILLEFYGKLGFVPWRRYRHGERIL